MNPLFLPEGPALFLEKEHRLLFIADTHFGAETEFGRRGVHIPSNTDRRLDRILSCIGKTSPDMLIILGDFKHAIPMTSRQEYAELPRVIDTLRDHVPLRLAPGNHDGGIERFLDKEEILPRDGALIEGIGVLHGHTYPAPELLGHLCIVGHHHTVLHLYDEVGCSLRSHPAYVMGTLRTECLGALSPPDAPTRVLFMPAFFEYAGGLDVRTLPDSGLSPIARCLDTADAEVFLDDGTYINSLEALINDERS
jgi:metallophosphoesterase superfamily enzyme